MLAPFGDGRMERRPPETTAGGEPGDALSASLGTPLGTQSLGLPLVAELLAELLQLALQILDLAAKVGFAVRAALRLPSVHPGGRPRFRKFGRIPPPQRVPHPGADLGAVLE